MSRIGKKPIDIPAGVEIKAEGSTVTVKGPKGTLTQSFNARMTFEQKDGKFIVKRPDDEIENKMLHGTTRAIIANMVKGVVDGFSKTLIVDGVGYTAEIRGSDLYLKVGFANGITVHPLEGVKISCTDPNTIVVTGIDRQAVGQQAAIIRAVKKPEPYHGKGIHYKDEVIVLRVSKAKKKESATASGSAAPAAK
ncbi:MAG: 50S ribosomal protein L6 [Bacilli bacterium]|jgi:large subunit ribosomal protein L6|nr:50S ribosomal protein L6 [Bacilli bacterium]